MEVIGSDDNASSIPYKIDKKYKELEMREMFASCNNFQDILDRYYLYYEGRLSFLPLYHFPLAKDTLQQLDLFKKINRLGFLCTNSQDGLSIALPPENTTLFMLLYPQSFKPHGCTVTHRQRAYIEGYIPTSIAEKLERKFSISEFMFFSLQIPQVHRDYNPKEDIYIKVTSFSWQTENGHNYVTLPTAIGIKKDGSEDWITHEKLINQIEGRKIKEGGLNFIKIIDPVWGRSNFLGLSLIHALETPEDTNFC